MTDFTDAINDLSFIERRFKALMEAIPALQAIDSLDTHKSELEAAIKDHQDTLATLAKLRAEAGMALEELEKAQDKRKEEFGTWVAEEKNRAQEASKAILEAADARAKSLIGEATSTRDNLLKEIDDANRNLATVVDAIHQAEDQYNKIQTKLQKIKESI